MEEKFSPVAQTRANYYTPTSPVQFVRVELLRGEQSKENAVCLTYKNISQVVVTGLDVIFKCKGSDGSVLFEGGFQYSDIEVKPGELFGQDDAVFITDKPIASVDVVLKNAYNGERLVRLDGIKRVRLPGPRRLTPELQAALEERMGKKGLRYAPQVLDSGWYCSCGAFHPNEEDTGYCSECRSDRILLQNALNTLMQPEEPEVVETAAPAEAPAAEQAPEEEAGGTRQFDLGKDKAPAEEAPVEEGGTRQFELGSAGAPAAAEPVGEESGKTRVMPSVEAPAAEEKPAKEELQKAEPAEPAVQKAAAAAVSAPAADPETERKDAAAENVIRWVPPVAAVLCAVIALCGYVYCQIVL